jgi:hypothetical protein
MTMVNNGIYTYIIDGWMSIGSAGVIWVAGANTISTASWAQQSGSYFEVEKLT